MVDKREMGHSISEVTMKFGFPRTTISRAYHEYRESGKTSKSTTSLRPKKICKKKDQRRLTRIINPDRRSTLMQIAADFNAELSTSVTMWPIQKNIIDMGFRSQTPTRVPLLIARHNALSLVWARQDRHWIVDDWKHVTWSDDSRFQLK
ncbi:HTH_Tnp_Tc3_2 domain-containing protein [Trichonephila clavipes]|nr:HTH_Tnp_Tc3_2 domain-containing protein [Trichonephila clavipes]